MYRVRYYIKLATGHEPAIWNFDQTPYYQNEVGAQNKPTMAVRGSTVPVVENKSAAHARWTARLSCCSDLQLIQQRWPWCEAMYKAAEEKQKYKQLQDASRTSGFQSWFSVTTAPKGTDRESDIIAMLERHLPLWGPGRRWEIMTVDDFSAHNTENIADSAY